MNNATVERIEIKLRGENVYDVYVNKEHIGYAGSYLSALSMVRDYIEDEEQQRKTYHVRCAENYCSYNHHGICYFGILIIGENGKCLCYE